MQSQNDTYNVTACQKRVQQMLPVGYENNVPIC